MDKTPKKVLFCDDSPTIVEAAYDELTDQGYEVAVAYDGLEAMELIELDPPDIIIMDMDMPKMKGDEAAAKIRANPETAKIPIIALTALSLKSLGEKAKLFDAYLVKPFGFEDMVKIVAEKIGKP